MGIAEQGDAGRLERRGPGHSFRDGAQGLARHTVNQVKINVGDPGLPKPAQILRDQLFGLDTVDGFLHRRIEILYAKTHPVNAAYGIGFDLFLRTGARVNFHRDFRLWQQVKIGLDPGHKFLELRRGDDGGRATAKMDMADFLAACDVPDQVNLRL